MVSKEKALTTLLRAVADLSEVASEAELRKAAQDVKLRTERLRGRSKEVSSKPQQPRSAAELDAILSALDAAPSREAGENLLSAADLTRGELVQLAKRRSVHVVKQDNLGRVAEKLIEALIGSRLNSQAIRGPSHER